MARFAEALATEPFILTDGGIETRILYETASPLHPQLEVAGLALDGGVGRDAMWRIYADDLDVGWRHGAAMIVGTPLRTVVSTVDGSVSPRPLCYASSCVHTSLGSDALAERLTEAF